MQIKFFDQGRRGFVAHRYFIPGNKSKYSVWFNCHGYAVDAERIDAKGRSFNVRADSKAWQYIERHKLAGLEGATEITRAALV
jgi:hypothetical protein